MAAGGVPIAAGENLRSLWEFKNYIAAGAVSYPEHDGAEAFNLPVTSHGAHDFTVHLLAACPNRSYLEAHGFGLDRFMNTPDAVAGQCHALVEHQHFHRHHVALPQQSPFSRGH
jgi:hypothetical protein